MFHKMERRGGRGWGSEGEAWRRGEENKEMTRSWMRTAGEEADKSMFL